MKAQPARLIDLRIFQFTLMEIGNWVDADQSTGRIVHVPNGSVFVTPLANYAKGFQYIWNEIPVLVTFESDWRRAKEILEGIANLVTAPPVARALAAGRLRLHGWVYDLHAAQLRVYDAAQDAFVSPDDVTPSEA